MNSFLTVAEVAEQLKLAKMTIYRLISSGELQAVKVGKSYRIEQAWLKAYLKKARTRGNASGRAGQEEARGLPEG